MASCVKTTLMNKDRKIWLKNVGMIFELYIGGGLQIYAMHEAIIGHCSDINTNHLFENFWYFLA